MLAGDAGGNAGSKTDSEADADDQRRHKMKSVIPDFVSERPVRRSPKGEGGSEWRMSGIHAETERPAESVQASLKGTNEITEPSLEKFARPLIRPSGTFSP